MKGKEGRGKGTNGVGREGGIRRMEIKRKGYQMLGTMLRYLEKFEKDKSQIGDSQVACMVGVFCL